MRMHVNENEFEVLGPLGRGKGGYSYLVTDGRERYVLKQIHHEPCSYYTFGDKLGSELRDYERLKALGIPMPKLLDVDHGRERILKDYIEGDTIYDLVVRNEMKPEYRSQMELLCQRLYPARTNIDYFPTNFVVREGWLWYVDYECNDYLEQWDFEHWGVRYWSRTPELEQWQRENGLLN